MAGSDAISAEMINKGGKIIRDKLYKLIFKVWKRRLFHRIGSREVSVQSIIRGIKPGLKITEPLNF